MDGQVDLLQREAVLHRQRGLGNQVGGPWPDDVSAEQTTGSSVGDHLDEALGLAERERPPGGGEGEASNLDVHPAFLGLLLPHANVSDLRVGVNAVRGRVIVGRAFGMARDVLDGAYALIGGDVGEHDAADHIADGPYACRARVQLRIHNDTPTLQLDAGLLGTEPLGIRGTTDGEQDLVGIDRAAFATFGEPHLEGAFELRDFGHLAVGVHRAAEARKVLGVYVHQVRVHHRKDLRQHLEDCDLAAESGEHGRKLHADDAAPDDGEPRRDFLKLEDLVGIDRMIGALQGDASDRRARRDHDVLRGDAIGGDLNGAVACKPSGTSEDGDAARLEQSLDALDQLIHHCGLAFLSSCPVEGDLVCDDAEYRAALGLAVKL